MISPSSIKKLFVYLIGLTVACFLHFSCQLLPESTLGMNASPGVLGSPTLSSNSSATQFDIIHNIDIGGAGRQKPKQRGSKFLDSPMCTFEHAIVSKSGQDYGFFNKKPKQLTILIADGVGGYGYRSTLYTEAFANDVASSPADTTKDLMEYAHNEVDKKAEKDHNLVGGACTAIIVNITVNITKVKTSNELELTCSNVGDCECIVFRPEENKIVFWTKKQKEKGFNDPLVLSALDDDDTPKQAEHKTFQLHRGDIVLAYTDGIGDNVWKKQIVGLIKSSNSAQELANNIVAEAYKVSKDQHAKTPFGRKLAEAYINNDDNAVYMLEKGNSYFWSLAEEEQQKIRGLKLGPTDSLVRASERLKRRHKLTKSQIHKLKRKIRQGMEAKIRELRGSKPFKAIQENKPDDMAVVVAIIR